ncbi:HAD family hydrolase [Embleya hyalina]|uniref:Haloacid dehalogenase n=1 Tax=Embleya hyalina TaxID=516124 RepID=A0A401YTU3_9ACTN|nr:haloacid dehalogenase-like hydrolase [Embleya hyalina]GCD98002.1 haloacid dehalogenase [Embleya hyalina]
MARHRLVLWDIDHTLIATGGVGREVFADAFRRVTGVTMREQASVHGRTEQVIFGDTARVHGLDPGEFAFPDFADALADGYRTRAAEMRERGHALPGAASLLAALAEKPGVVQTVVSGNPRSVSRIKLEVFGLDGLVDFSLGAYGDDHIDRPELVRAARELADARYGTSFTAADTVIIGDTPADVDAGRQGGARVIAVATGASDKDALAHADHVLDDLSDTARIVELVCR